MRSVQVKVRDPLRTRAIPERLRGVFTRRYTNPRLPYLTLPSAADTFDLQQVRYGVYGCVQVLGRMDLIFIDTGMKINGAYYRELLQLLTQKQSFVRC